MLKQSKIRKLTRIFLNTRGTNHEEVSIELVELLQYFENTTSETAQSASSDKIKKMQTKIESIKFNDEIGVKYMNAWEERILEKQDAYKEGAKNVTEQTILKMLNEKCSYDLITKVTGYDAEQIQAIVSKEE